MLVWREGMADWAAIGSVDELRPYVRYVANTHTTVPPPQSRAVQNTTAASLPPPFPAAPPPQPAPRESTAKSLGGFHIIVSTLTLITWPIVILGFLRLAEDFGPLSEVLRESIARSGQLAFFGLGLLLAVPLLIAGVGLRQGRTWAPQLAAFCAWGGLAIQACHLIFTVVSAVVPMLNAATQDEVADGWGSATRLVAIAVVSSVGGLLYDVLSLRSLGMNRTDAAELPRM
jgi:hypothetical protein